jgi:predicted porin
MKVNRCAIACALALASSGALAQQRAPNTAVVADTLIQLYGHLDVSVDDLTKGIAGKTQGGNTAMGRLGYQPDLSSNLSAIGVRGGREVAPGLRMVYQVETQIDVTATPGPSTVPDNTIKGAFASRNTYLGIAADWGALKLGKTDTPYKLSTGRMDPFSASIGDYNSIMGNTGGDNRAEFDARLSHAIWYESPSMSGFRVNALFAPGQNRSSDNSNAASGEPDCTGGNQPTCNDGSFDNAYSIAGVYQAGPLYAIAAFERHANVNRTGDEGGAVPIGAVGIANEQAWKVGAQYKIGATTLNGIIERMTRSAPNADFNERQRNGFWLAATEKFSEQDDINVGWAHAGKTPGAPGPAIAGPQDNVSNMFALGYKHHFDRQANWYAVFAMQKNHNDAHYDLGASGHGITTDCHDANGACFTGGKVQGVSVGMQYNF